MDTRTGEILDLQDVLKKPKSEQKHFIEVPPEEENKVFAMNRHERRKWAKLQRKKLKTK